MKKIVTVVYETGPLGDKNWKDSQKLPGFWYVARGQSRASGL